MLFSRKATKANAQETGDAIALKSLHSQGVQLTTPHILDSKESGAGYLAGQLLVATPLITESCFHKSVVYIFSHSAEGAMGVIINQPLDLVHFSSLLENVELPEGAAHKHIPVYLGGPVDRARGFVLHSADYITDACLARHGDVALTASSTILLDILSGKGPKNAILAVGCAGWDAGQLERELADNSWIHVPATASLVFETEDEHKWGAASKSLGVDMNFYSTLVGHA